MPPQTTLLTLHLLRPGWALCVDEPLDGHDDDGDDEQSDDGEVEFAGRRCRDRGVALHLVLALQAFRCELVDPGEMSAGTKPRTSPANSSLFPGRQAEQAEQQLADLQQDPGCDEVQRRYSEDVRRFSSAIKTPRPPSSPVRSQYYVSVRAGSSESVRFQNSPRLLGVVLRQLDRRLSSATSRHPTAEDLGL